MAFSKTRALQEAERSLAQGRVSEAVQQYLNIVENDPSDLAVINLAGDLCVRAKNIPEALKLFRRLAESYVYEGFVPRAIAIYKKVLKLEPSNVDSMLRLAGLYSGQGLDREARDLYAQALSVCQDQNLQGKALEVVRRIAADEPGNIVHRLRLAELYKAAGQVEDAFKTYLEAAETALSESNQDVAATALAQAAKLQPDDRRLRELRRRLSPDAPQAAEVPAADTGPAPLPDWAPAPPPGEEPVPAPADLEDAGALEEPGSSPSVGGSEIDLSDDWETIAAGQSAPGAAVDFGDLELEIDFYIKYGMARKALEKIKQIERDFPDDLRIAEFRRRCERAEAGKPSLSDAASASGEGRQHALRGDFNSGGGPTPSANPEGGERFHAGVARGQPDFAASLGALLNELGSEASPLPSEKDPQTHYELGIAFREMGLVDDAIGELQKAVRESRPAADRQRFLSACSLLALCFVEKQMPALAAKWYTRALEVPGLDSDAILALQYDLAVAYELAGNLEAARQSFLEVYGQNVDYRDVAAKVRQLAASQ